MRLLATARFHKGAKAAFAIALCAAVVVAGPGPAFASPAFASPAFASPAKPNTQGYYLALGDSLASGYQPGVTLSSNPFEGFPGGYAADLALAKGLALVDLGCPGETTASFHSTPALGACAAAYGELDGAASQEAAALTFLERHPHQVKLVTIDIGADNVLGCLSSVSISLPCLAAGEAQVAAQLPGELATLRATLAKTDPGARLLAMNYYDPALAALTSGNYAVAFESLAATTEFNTELDGIYAHAGLRVADVVDAFGTYSLFPFHQITVGGTSELVPNDVYEICVLTHMCASPPNVHPNDAGYARIASAFERLVG